jgi:hypothetical protein
MSNVDDISTGTISCPVCDEHYNISELFIHLMIYHPQFLIVWSSITYPETRISNNNYTDFNTWSYTSSSNINLDNYIIYDNPRYQYQYQEDIAYETLSHICETIGNHMIGVNNIDFSAPITEDFDDTTMCVICREYFKKETNVRKINSCGHLYCSECITVWFEDHKTCPICKQEVIQEPKDSEHDID